MKSPGAAWAFLLCLAVASPPTAQAAQASEEAPSATLSWLAGSWRGAGTMFGHASEASLEVRPALGGRFLELRYRAGGFEGRAFYRPLGGGRWQARWFDNRGIAFGIEAAAGERTLTSDWGSAETERGRTIYRLLGDGRLEVADMVAARDGSMREFARHVLHKADAGPTAVVNAFVQAYNDRDFAGLEALLAEQARWYSVDGAQVSIEGEGASAIGAWVRTYLGAQCTSCRSELLSASASDGFVATVERASWTNEADACVAQTSVAVYRIADGRIEAVWYYPASRRERCETDG